MKILIFGHSDSCIHMLTDRFKYPHINIFYKVLIHKNYICIYMKHQYTYIYFQTIRVTGHRSNKGRAWRIISPRGHAACIHKSPIKHLQWRETTYSHQQNLQLQSVDEWMPKPIWKASQCFWEGVPVDVSSPLAALLAWCPHHIWDSLVLVWSARHPDPEIYCFLGEL